MKKLGLFLMPLMAVSLITSCRTTPSSQPTEYFVTFETHGADEPIPTKRVKDGDKIEPPTTPTRKDDTFKGWFIDDKTFEKEYTFADPVTSDLTLYANWSEPLTYHTVEFETNGGTPHINHQIVEDGKTATKPEPAPTKERYGEPTWVDENGKVFDFSAPITSDIVLYADWGEIISYTVTIKGENITQTSVTFEYNNFEPISKTLTIDQGYKLAGGISIEPSDAAFAELTDTKTIKITPEMNEAFTITLSTEKDIRYYYSIIASGDHITYYKDENLTIPLNQAAAYTYEDLTFYMIGDHDDNNLYSPPATLDVEAGKTSIPYTIETTTETEEKIIKKVTINKANITGDITIRGDALKAKFNLSASGEHITYYKNQEATDPLGDEVIYIFQDFTFYMLGEEGSSQNSEGYVPPTSLDIKAGSVSVTNYKIEAVTGTYANLMKKVTIYKAGITGDITIQGAGVNVNYYHVDFPYLFGLKEPAIQDTYFAYNQTAVIEFTAKKSISNDDLLGAENIFVNFTGGTEETDWISPADDEFNDKGKFEHTQEGKYILTIYADVVSDNFNTIQVIARAKNYHSILELFTWNEINQMSGTVLATKIFDYGDTKTTNGATFQIIDFNKDELITSTSGNPQHAGITFDCLTAMGGSMHWNKSSSTANHNYIDSTLNKACQENGNVYNAMPSEVMKYVKKVRKQIDIYDGGAWHTDRTYDTKLFPLSNNEIRSGYTYYKNGGSRIKESNRYWLRSPNMNDSDNVRAYFVEANGNVSNIVTYNANLYVYPGFCI